MSLMLGAEPLFGTPPVVGACAGEISVRLMPKEDCEAIICNGHYSRTVVWSSNLHLGIYANAALIGAMQFGPAMNPASGARVVEGSTPETWLELNRLWLEDAKPANTGSRAIACAIRVIRSTRPRVTWIHSGSHGNYVVRILRRNWLA